VISGATWAGSEPAALRRHTTDASEPHDVRVTHRPRLLLVTAIAAAITLAACGTGGSSPSAALPTASPSTSGPPPAVTPSARPATASSSAVPSASSLEWAQLETTGPTPAAREDHTWTTDPANGSVWLFGGRDGATVFDDLWRFDAANRQWEQVTVTGERPPGRFGHTGTWVDGVGLVVWSGQAGSTFFADLWAYDPAANSWSELTASGDVPPARYGSCAALAPDGRLWISHGFTADGGRFADTRAYSFATAAWTDLSADGPIIRCLHDCLFTPDGDFILYAGQTTGQPAIGDLWSRPAEGAWMAAPGGGQEPVARQLYALAQTSGQAFVFGGGASDGAKLGDLWRLDLATLGWEALAPAGEPPSARSGATMAVSPADGRILLFGGTDGSSALGDTWQLVLPG
jgi:hypothetical protein